jgi:hypothetical protein
VFQIDPAMAGQHVACPLCQGVVAIGGQPPAQAVAAPVEVKTLDPPQPELSPAPVPSATGGFLWAPPLDRATPPATNPAPQIASTLVPTQQSPALPSAALPTPAPVVEPPTELLGCPRCGGAFRVTAEMAGQQMSCPHCQGVLTIPGPSMPPESHEAVAARETLTSQPLATPAAAAGPSDLAEPLMAFRIQEGPKKILVGDKIVEVRRLTPEEKAKRRFIKRLLLFGFYGAILAGAMLYLFYYGLPWVRRG